MHRELLLLRHGKSDWSTNHDDFHRPLTRRGKRGAQRIGIWLAQQNLLPDRVLSSPAVRARATAEKMLKAVGHNVDTIIEDPNLYGASTAQLLRVLAECPKNTQRLLLVGHNPGLETLLACLCQSRIPTNDDKLLPTATLAHFRLRGSWQKLATHRAELLSITRAANLPKNFPFPNPLSTEYRKRPAYYYHQSSVIPYRISKTGLQILLISASNNKHFVVPKGIKEPGLSARASAAKEAWEEAGVEGQVGKKKLGQYHYVKWGATCTVQVYPMAVTRLLSAPEWQESYRGRQWLSPEQACQRLSQKALVAMIGRLQQRVGCG